MILRWTTASNAPGNHVNRIKKYCLKSSEQFIIMVKPNKIFLRFFIPFRVLLFSFSSFSFRSYFFVFFFFFAFFLYFVFLFVFRTSFFFYIFTSLYLHFFLLPFICYPQRFVKYFFNKLYYSLNYIFKTIVVNNHSRVIFFQIVEEYNIKYVMTNR